MALYNLIFQGKIIDGASLNKVKLNIAQLFKINAAKTDTLFSGKAIIIKKNLNTESAKKYLTVLKKAGAIVKAVKIEATTSTTPPPPDTPSPALQSGNILSPGLASLVSYSKKAATDKSEIDEQQKKTTLQLLPIGYYKAASSAIQKKIQIPDISHLTLSKAQSGSLEEYAEKIEVIELPDIKNLTMSKPNSGSLEEFSTHIEPAELPDIRDLNILAQNNTPLCSQSPTQDPVKLPDISGLSMSDAQEGRFEAIERQAEAIKIPETGHLNIIEINVKPVISGKAIFKIS